MIVIFRNSIYVKIFWALMAIYLLNISVDTTDPLPESVPEYLSINDPESIVEIVVEEILGFEDAIKEFDDPDTENNYKKTNLKIDLVAQGASGTALPGLFISASNLVLTPVTIGLPKGFQQRITPPPKC